MCVSMYYNAPDLYELAFSLPPQRFWRAHAFNAVLSELDKLSRSGIRLLDVGCGAGVLSKMIALRHPDTKIRAVDSSPHMIQYARKVHPHPAVTYSVGSFWDEEGFYDCVTAAYCWHFFPLARAAAKLKSLLRHQGSGLIVATTETPVTKIHRKVFGILSSNTLSLYWPHELSESLQKEGFSVRWQMIDRLEGSYLVVAHLV